MKIAIFSGSFNPVHNGHLSIAQEVLTQGDADELWFLVSPQNPLKKNADLFHEDERLRMVKMAVENKPGMFASDFEFHLPRPSYTIRTLESLRITYPEHQFRLLIGGDNFSIIHKWTEYQRIINEFGLIVYPRPGFEIKQATVYPNTTFISAPLIDISATEIREKLKKHESVTGMVPDQVANYLLLKNIL